MKICVYCSSSAGLPAELYAAGHDFGLALAKRGHTLVYGGYNEGIMGAVARGAAQGGAPIVAVVPSIFDREDFTAAECTKVLHVGTMSERKATMEAEADAFAVLPGGIGTFDEFFEAFVLRTLGQMNKPIAVYNIAHSMDKLDDLLENIVEQGMLKQANRELVPFYTKGEEVLDFLSGGIQ